MGELFQPAHLLVLGLVVVIFAVPFVIAPFWMIFKKASFPPAISILMFVPFVGILVLYIVAFSEWKVVPRQAATVSIPPYPPQV